MNKISSCKAMFFLCSFCFLVVCSSAAQRIMTPANFRGIDSDEPIDVSGVIASGRIASSNGPVGTFKTVYTFCAQSGCADGETPVAGLIQGVDGNLYGTTTEGGVNGNHGTVFKITSDGNLTTIYSFCSQANCTDGAGPQGTLVLAPDGNFYGTTPLGGAHNMGTVFKITPEGTLTTLYSFCSSTNCTDGEGPQGGLVLGTDGNLYGQTYQGGANTAPCGPGAGCGTIFRITTAGAYTTLYSFCSQITDNYCADGATPYYGPLIQATDGNLYGTTSSGGSPQACGTIFKITTGGDLTTLHIFNVYNGYYDGCQPQAGLIQALDGNFYGTADYGGMFGQGSIFEMTPPPNPTVSVLYSFCAQTNCTDGSIPLAPLIQATDGNFYGTTGGNGGGGTVFQFTQEHEFYLLHSFMGAELDHPFAPLFQATNGTLYGTTIGGSGTVFSLAVVGLLPFVETVPTSGPVGTNVLILGNNLTGSTAVTFKGTAAKFTVVSDTEIQTTVPPGATTGTVEVTTPKGTLNSNVPFRVTGQQSPPMAEVTPSNLTFNNQNVGTTSPSQIVTLSNKGAAALSIKNITASANYLESDDCNGSVAGGNSCTIEIQFSPMTPGRFYGTLTITDDSGGVEGSTQTVSLSGTGVSSAGADLFLRISPTPTTVQQGDLLTYAFPVWNLGPDNAVHEVLTTQVPAGTTFDYIRISGTPGLGTCTTPPYQGTGQIVCHENGRMAPNSTWTVRLTVKVTAVAGTVITEDAATVADTPDPNLANNTAKSIVTVQ